LIINPAFKRFVEQELLPQTELKPQQFWLNFAQLITEFSPRNAELLNQRKRIQSEIDQWHRTHRDQLFDPAAYFSFLESIGYIHSAGEDFSISTDNVDAEIAQIAGPQLVVPLKNARFALNAANARWGSLYDALYGSDIIAEEAPSAAAKGYDPSRGNKVILWAREFLDKRFPIAHGTHQDATGYQIVDSAVQICLSSGHKTQLLNPDQFIAFSGSHSKPTGLLFRNNGLHIEIQFDDNSPIGQTDKAGISDVIVEAAITTIMDCEDSVAAVDPEDKLEVYRNWLGLMLGTLTASFKKGSSTVTRALNDNRVYQTANNESLQLPGR